MLIHCIRCDLILSTLVIPARWVDTVVPPVRPADWHWDAMGYCETCDQWRRTAYTVPIENPNPTERMLFAL